VKHITLGKLSKRAQRELRIHASCCFEDEVQERRINAHEMLCRSRRDREPQSLKSESLAHHHCAGAISLFASRLGNQTDRFKTLDGAALW
jgi:hypothetical protein